MRTINLKGFLCVMVLISSAPLWAYNFSVENEGVTIYYNKTSDNTVEVTYKNTSYNSYSGVVAIPEAVEYDGVTYTVTSIGNNAFLGCSALTSITVSDNVTNIGSGAFEQCTSLTEVQLPASLETIGRDAFYYCTALPTITIPDNVKTIEQSTLSRCTSLIEVQLPASLETIGENALDNCTALTAVIIPDNTTNIGNYAFLGCTSLAEVQLSESLETLGIEAFASCSALTAITIPDKVTSIGNYTFSRCTSLAKVQLSESLETIGERAFFNCTALTAITIPENVTTIGSGAFEYCSSLYDVKVLCTTPPSIESDTFSSTDFLYSINVPSGCGAAYSVASYWSNYIIVEGDGVSLSINVDEPGTLGEKILAETENVYDVNYLTLSGTLNSDDIYNIQNRMPNLIEIDMQNVDMTELQSDMFNNRKALRKIVLPSNLQSIGSYAMYDCYSLEEISLSATLKSISSYAMCGCYKLEKILLPETLESIDYNAFAYCKSLSEIVIPEGVTSIGTYAFEYCTNLRNATLPSTIATVPNGLFNRCTTLETVELPEGITEIGLYAFYNNTNLKDVTFPSTLESLGCEAFYGCTSLTEITLPGKLVYCYRPFYNCTNITNVTCEALLPPYLQNNNDIIYNVNKSNCTLYVPEMSVSDYKLTVGWDEFTNIKGIEIYPEYISVYKDYKLTLPETLPTDWKPTVELGRDPTSETTGFGTLTVNGDPTLSMALFTIDYDPNTYINYYSNTSNTASNSLISNASMRADSIYTTVWLRNDRWAFLSFPYDVKVSDIVPEFDNTSWVVRKYSGLARANSDMDNTWQNMTIDSTLHAGEGYIWQCTRSATSYCGFKVPAINNTNKNNIFTKDAVTVTLNEYQSEYSHNRSWNLVGNPYPCFYDSRFMEFSAPITIWNDYSSTYEAYSLTDDSRILRPGEAFFVQRPVDAETIVFPTDGRQTDRSVRELITTYAQAKRVQGIERSIFNLYLSDGNTSDKTRFVINPTAQTAYDASMDACKFMSSDMSVAQLYTMEDGVRMAINERPLGNGIVMLGAYFGGQGTYTISLDTQSDVDVILVDNATGSETNLNAGDYTFDADAGTAEGRFYISLSQNATGINDMVDESGNAITVEGNRIVVNADSDANIVVYTTDGRAVAFGKGSVDTSSIPAGLYIVKANGAVRKVRVTK